MKNKLPPKIEPQLLKAILPSDTLRLPQFIPTNIMKKNMKKLENLPETIEAKE